MNDGYVGGMIHDWYMGSVKTQDARLACWRDENAGRTTGMTALTELQSVQRRDEGIPPYGLRNY